MSTLDEANKLGTLLNSWGKIIIASLLAFSTLANAYYQIYSTKLTVIEIEKEMLLIREDIKEQINLAEERSEKRYTRGMESAKELKDFIKYHEERILKLEIDGSCLKGKYEATH